MKYDTLPADVRSRGRFCLWRFEWVKGDARKVPYTAAEKKAKVNQDADFCSYQDVLERYRKGDFNGIGLKICNGIDAIDIDHCVVKGKISDFALSVIESLDSYTEFSPSGTGIRILFDGEGQTYDPLDFYSNNRELGLEIYLSGTSNRFVTLTGNVIHEKALEKRGDVVAEVMARYMRKNKGSGRILMAPRMNPLGSYEGGSDAEVLQKAFSAKNGSLFRGLFDGEMMGYSSKSEGDAALAMMLLYWTNHDLEQTKRILRESERFRKKFERKDYLERTVSNAERMFNARRWK